MLIYLTICVISSLELFLFELLDSLVKPYRSYFEHLSDNSIDVIRQIKDDEEPSDQ